MLELSPDQYTNLRHWFVPERPGPLIGLHVLNSGHGTLNVDCWPQLRVILSNVAGNYSLVGDPTALKPQHLSGMAGMIEAPISFLPLLRESFADLRVWQRVVYSLGDAPQFVLPDGYVVRRLTAVDTPTIQALSPVSSWIAKTWGGAAGLAASGLAWGASRNGRLAAIACTFFLGDHIEEIGVATEPLHRGRGLSVACAGALCQDIRARCHTPSWTTSPDNIASLRVAQKLGFSHHHDDVLYVTGTAIPKPAIPE